MAASCLLCSARLAPLPSICELLAFGPIEPTVICSGCRDTFQPLAGHPQCVDCGKAGATNAPCADCLSWRARDSIAFRNTALYADNAAMTAFLHQYREQGDYQLKAVFQAEVSAAARASRRVVVPLPVAAETLCHRGFNQNAALLSCPFTDCLALGASVQLKPEQGSAIQGRAVLLVADVYKTGTAIRSAARVLLENGARSVNGLTLAR